jgi:anti-sigma factor RsiW
VIVMSDSACESLDAYLVGWLSEDEAARFEIHLARCPACRRQCEQQQRIDRLLAAAVGHLEPAPAPLINRIERRLRPSSRRRALRWAWGLSATALGTALLILGSWLAARRHDTPRNPQPIVQQATEPAKDRKKTFPPGRASSPADFSVQVTLNDPSSGIVVPLATKAPDVSVFWIYPTIRPARAADGPAAH